MLFQHSMRWFALGISVIASLPTAICSPYRIASLTDPAPPPSASVAVSSLTPQSAKATPQAIPLLQLAKSSTELKNRQVAPSGIVTVPPLSKPTGVVVVGSSKLLTLPPAICGFVPYLNGTSTKIGQSSGFYCLI